MLGAGTACGSITDADEPGTWGAVASLLFIMMIPRHDPQHFTDQQWTIAGTARESSGTRQVPS
jgi:hypothetical protein